MSVCEGQGDIEIKLFNKGTWDYINSDYPVFKKGEYSADETPPAHCQQRIWDECFVNESPLMYDGVNCPADVTINVTSGSGNNDRVICLQSDFGDTFFSVMEAMEYARDNDLEIIEEYQGCIY